MCIYIIIYISHVNWYLYLYLLSTSILYIYSLYLLSIYLFSISIIYIYYLYLYLLIYIYISDTCMINRAILIWHQGQRGTPLHWTRRANSLPNLGRNSTSRFSGVTRRQIRSSWDSPRYSPGPLNEQNSMRKTHQLDHSPIPEIPIWRAAWSHPLKNFSSEFGSRVVRLSEGKRREILEILCQALVYLHDQARSAGDWILFGVELTVGQASDSLDLSIDVMLKTIRI